MPPMYTKRIQLVNYGPIEKLDIEFPFDGETPKPVVLVGENGSGKSILLSHLVNGLLKAKDAVYPATPEVEPGRVYKFRTNFYIKSGKQYSFGRVDFEEDFFVSELTTMRPKQEYPEVPIGIIGTAAELMWRKMESVSNDHSESNLATTYAKFNKIRAVFANNCVLYFPFNRFEEPAWLNEQNLTAQVQYVDRKRLVAHSSRRAIAMSPLHENQDWLFGVIYDKNVPETRTVRVPMPVPEGAKPWVIEGARTEPLENARSILAIALQLVRHILRDNSNASFRIGSRRNRFVALHGDDGTIVPNIFQLSSGETSLLNTFLSILRDFEWSGSQFSSAADIRGIVVVDEIDLHLHAIHQHKVLPNLIRLFPKVQFVVTTHSPLFVLGMEKLFGEDGFALYRLPDGHRISPEEFSEFGNAYQAFTETIKFSNDMRMVIEKPIVFVEGATDLKYIQKASHLLGHEELLERIEIRDGNGAPNLKKIWDTSKHIDVVNKKTLLLFDCDNQDVVNGNRSTLFRRVVPIQDENPIKKGIENLFGKSTLEKARSYKAAFIDVVGEHSKTKRGETETIPEQWTINKDEKANLCNWLCENGTQEDFQGFRIVFGLLEELMDLHPEPSGKSAITGHSNSDGLSSKGDVANLEESQ